MSLHNAFRGGPSRTEERIARERARDRARPHDPEEYQGPDHQPSAASHQAHLNRENSLNNGSGQVGNPYHDRKGKFTDAGHAGVKTYPVFNRAGKQIRVTIPK